MEHLKTEHDVLIIGGGPAGMSAALWCADLGLNAVLFEKNDELGGQLLWTFNKIENYLGLEAANGRELKEKFLEHLKARSAPVFTGTTIVDVELTGKEITLENGGRIAARCLIIATGVRRRRLCIPGELEFEGRGILESGTAARVEVSGRSVVIIGGGDAAVENALILSETARSVNVIHRREELTARREFVERARATGNISFRPNTEVTAIRGDRTVTAVDALATDGARTTIIADAVLIRIGVIPNTEMFKELKKDTRGYILTDAFNTTSLPGIFAVGDVANPVSPAISSAVGSGATAAKRASALISAWKRV